MKFYGARLPLAFALIVLGVCSAQASRNNIRHCADDYRRFCSQWALRPVVWKTACAGMATD